jgi:exopolyphosphatase / guanosine-5'-triphosphate,3'-diphosphate pyrophosphatase
VRRVAAIDCGTNSLRLLLAERGPGGELVELARRTEIVRLGQGVDATGAFADEALSRTFAVLDDYARMLAEAEIRSDCRRLVATSAVRDVSNREAFVSGVRDRIGVLPEVISGAREAELSFVGALSSGPIRERLGAAPVLVMDIGGGSTELVLGDTDGRVDSAVSLPMGSVRLTERFFAHSPPRPEERAAASAYVDLLLDESGAVRRDVGSWVGVAGTVVTLAWLAGAAPAEPSRLSGSVMTAAVLDGLLTRLGALSTAEIRAIPGMHPGRADVITAGALVAARVAARLPEAELVVSIADILDGVALELLRAAATVDDQGAAPRG